MDVQGVQSELTRFFAPQKKPAENKSKGGHQYIRDERRELLSRTPKHPLASSSQGDDNGDGDGDDDSIDALAINPRVDECKAMIFINHLVQNVEHQISIA